jgi:hypothetical protein
MKMRWPLFRNSNGIRDNKVADRLWAADRLSASVTLRGWVKGFRAEKMPERFGTQRGCDVWFNNYIPHRGENQTSRHCACAKSTRLRQRRFICVFACFGLIDKVLQEHTGGYVVGLKESPFELEPSWRFIASAQRLKRRL